MSHLLRLNALLNDYIYPWPFVTPLPQVDAFFAYRKGVTELRQQKTGLWQRKLALLRQAVKPNTRKRAFAVAVEFDSCLRI